MGLAKSVYNLIFDSNAAETLVPTRKELAATKAIMEETMSPMSRYAAGWDRLNQLLNKELISVEQYNAALQALRDELPENQAKQQDLANAQAAAQRVLAALTNENHRYAAARADARDALQAGLISEREYASYLDSEKAKLSANVKAESERAAALRRSADLVRQNETALERYDRQLAELNAHYKTGTLSQETYHREQRRLANQYESTLPTLTEFKQQQVQTSSTFAGMLPVIDPVSLAMRGFGEAMQFARTIASTFTTQLGKSFDAIQEIGNSAQSLGVSVEAFQTLQYAANQADVPIERLTKGMFEMEKSIAKAAAGSEEEAKGFEAIGVSFEELDRLSPDQQFRKIAAAIHDMPDGAEKANAIASVFGKAGFELRRVFDGGTEAIDDAAAALGRMNGLLDQESIDTINNLDGSWKQFNATVDSLWRRMLVDLSPTLQTLLDDTSAWLQDEATQETLTAVLHDVAESFKAVAASMEMVIANGSRMLSTMQAITGSAPFKLAQALAPIAAGNSLAAGTAFSDKVADTKSATNRNAWDDMLKEMDRVGGRAMRLGADDRESSKAIERAEKKAADEFTRLVESLKTPAEKYADEMDKIVQALIDDRISTEEYERLKLAQEMKRPQTDNEKAAEAFRAEEKRYRDTLSKQAETALDALKTPLQKSKEVVDKWREAVEAGVLSQRDFNRLKNAEDQRLANMLNKPDALETALQSRIDTISVGSHEYYQMMARNQSGGSKIRQFVDPKMAMVGGPNGKTPEEKQVDLLTQINQAIRQQKLELDVTEVTL